MNVWTVFFLVVSIVTLAAPLLLSRGERIRNGSGSAGSGDVRSGAADDELELDLALGRLAREDYEALCGRKLSRTGPDDGAGGEHGNISES
jgi:hypothetical protein